METLQADEQTGGLRTIGGNPHHRIRPEIILGRPPAGHKTKSEQLLMTGAPRAFDSVHGPVETEVLDVAASGSSRIMSGHELSFHQGVDAFRRSTGIEVDAAVSRRSLSGKTDAEAEQ